MPITSHISDEEISIDRQKGLLTGDADPATTQDGVLTKFRERDQSIKDDFEALSAIFDDHDHDPENPTGAGGQPLGTGGVRSFAAGAITTPKLTDLCVTNAKVATGAIDTVAIRDEAATNAKFGAPDTQAIPTLAGSGTYSWSPPTPYPLFHIEGDLSGYLSARASGGNIVITNNHTGPIGGCTIVYRGAD